MDASCTLANQSRYPAGTRSLPNPERRNANRPAADGRCRTLHAGCAVLRAYAATGNPKRLSLQLWRIIQLHADHCPKPADRPCCLHRPEPGTSPLKTDDYRIEGRFGIPGSGLLGKGWVDALYFIEWRRSPASAREN